MKIINPFKSTEIIQQLYQKVYDEFIFNPIKCGYQSYLKDTNGDSFSWNIKKFINNGIRHYRRYDLFGNKKECKHFYSDGLIYSVNYRSLHYSFEMFETKNIVLARRISPFTKDTLPEFTINFQTKITLSGYQHNSMKSVLASLIKYDLNDYSVDELMLSYHFDPELFKNDVEKNGLPFNDYCEHLESIKLKNI